MALPLIGDGVTAAGRGLAAYLAKRKAMRVASREVGKQAVMRAGYGAGKTAVHPRTAAMPNLRGRTYPSDAARIANTPAPFVNAPQGRGGGGPITLASLAAAGGYEYGRRHPREEAMENLKIREMTGAATTPEELKRIKQIQSLNMTPEAKKMLLDDLTSGAGEYDVEIDGKTYGYEFDERPTKDTLRGLTNPASSTGVDTFMGMPVSAGRFRGRKGSTQSSIPNASFIGDTAEWNAREGIFPRFLIDQLINNKTITKDDVIDLKAPDGDSFKIIPRGTGRFDSTRRA